MISPVLRRLLPRLLSALSLRSARVVMGLALPTVPLLIASSVAIGAQRGGSVPSAPATDTVVRTRAPGDTGRRVGRDTTLTRKGTPGDTVRRDSARTKPLVDWRLQDDSIAQALLNRPGFRATRYQGDKVIFNAQTKALQIQGAPAAVAREQTLVVGDTVLYNDSSKLVTARGDTVILHDPSRQGADIVARGQVTYNSQLGRGFASNISTSIESGDRYYLSGSEVAFSRDTSKAARSAYYIHDGIITSCDDSVPDYYFKANEIKYVSKSLIVARPATLYISGVPVFWLPFLFQDVRNGRRSGLLTPRFGLSEFVRNSPSYRRHVENIGYYANLGNYMDAEAWFDWRSSARASVGDPGFSRVNGQFRYRWLDRFITGGISANRLDQRDGQTNTAVSWFHSQDFSATSKLYADVNFVTNTRVQRQTTFDPRAVLATIASNARYGRKVGPFSVDLGGNRVQYPGRSEVTENYPTVSVTSPTLALNRWLDWTPTFQYQRNAQKNRDEPGTFAYRYFTNSGVPDSSRINASSKNENISLQTPFTIRGFQITASATEVNQYNDFPITRTLIDPADTTQRLTRTYARSFSNAADFNLGFSLPTFLPNSFRVVPSVTFGNVVGDPYFIRTELSGGRWVHQSKRPAFGLSASPTLFGFFPGFGPLARIRQQITPTFSYSYSPSGSVSPEFLAALNRSPSGFLGNLPKNQIGVRLTQTFEGKLRSDTGDANEGTKIKLLALEFTDLTYDFERARMTHRTGLTTDFFSYTATTDLLPGFSLRSDYSLFQGDIQSDSARFSPFRQATSATFTLNGHTGIFAALNRIFGRAVPNGAASQMQAVSPDSDNTLDRRMASLPVAGSYARDRQYQIPETQGWTSAISFSSTRQRPPVGGRVIAFDPATVCEQFRTNPIVFDQCRQNALLNPATTSLPFNDPIAGGVFVRIPPQETILAQSSFHITPNWSASWGTAYDAVHRQFASQQVTLQRELHDWRAIFSFSQSPNGNFFFTFFIVNKAQPDLKFNYDKPTYRQQDLR
ncbi:MAG: putative LPS assembly protein LptD [Gemmatimonadaceae bacterium]